MSALSLVQIIRKKWGDDIVNAARELEERVGFPKEVAERIARGDLPMDEPSRLARQADQARPEGVLHGSTHDITRFDGNRAYRDNDSGAGTYMSDSAHDVSENYAGVHGADFRGRATQLGEQRYYGDDGLEPNGADLPGIDEYILEAEQELKGANDGVIYPLRILEEAKLANYSDEAPWASVDDFMEDAAESLSTSYPDETIESLLDPDGEFYEEVIDEAYAMMFENQPVADAINDVLWRYDYRGSVGTDLAAEAGMGQRSTWGEVRDAIDNEIAEGRLYAEDADGGMINAGGLLSEILEELDYDGVIDSESATRFKNMEAGEHTVIFPGREHLIRGEYAAYDPQYRGKNIMGNADPRLLAATAAGTAGTLGVLASDAEAGFITKGGRELLEAWHGSPYKFDRFSMDKVGTGEGAQAYGHGLYFADSPLVAKNYRDTLTAGKGNIHAGRNPWTNELPDEAWNEMGEIMGRYDIAGDIMPHQTQAGFVRQMITENSDRMAPEDIAVLEKYAQPEGSIYRVEIDAHPDSFLHWEQPLVEQPNALQAFQQMYSDEAMRLDPEILGPLYSNPADVDMATLGLFDKSKGAQAYNTIKDMNYVRGAPAMSAKLLEQGINGIRYLDASSRLTNIVDKRNHELLKHYGGDIQKTVDHLVRLYHGPDKDDYAQQLIREFEKGPSYNYVIFDDGIINATHRDGVLLSR